MPPADVLGTVSPGAVTGFADSGTAEQHLTGLTRCTDAASDTGKALLRLKSLV